MFQLCLNTVLRLIYRLKKGNKNNTEINNYIKSIEMKGVPKIPSDIEIFKSYVSDPIVNKLYSYDSDSRFSYENN